MSSLRDIRTFQNRYRNYTDEQYAQDVEEDCNRLSRQYMGWSKGFFTLVFGSLFVWMFLIRLLVSICLLKLGLVFLGRQSDEATLKGIVLFIVSVINVYFLCKFFLFNSCSIDKKAAQDEKDDAIMTKKKRLTKKRSEWQSLSMFMSTFTNKHHALKVTMKLSMSIPMRTYYAYRTSTVISDLQTLNVYYTWIIISICLIPIMFTSKNDFFRRRLVILVDGTFTLVFGFAMPFYSIVQDIVSVFGIDDFTTPWPEEWTRNVQLLIVSQRMFPRDGWGALFLVATYLFWHLAYNQVFKDLRSDYTLINKARRCVASKEAEETKKESNETRKSHRTSRIVRQTIKVVARYQLHFMFFCIIYAVAFTSIVIASRTMNNCPKECAQPLYHLLPTSQKCNCYIWKADCTELKLETNETMYQYFERIPSKTMFLSLYNCPLLNDIGAPFVRLDLTYLHVENTQVSKLTWKPTELLTGVAIINAPLDHVPKVLYERVRTTKLELSGTRLRTIPAQAMKFIRSLKLRNNPLLERKDLSLLNLRSLDLSGSPITSNLAEMYFKVKLNVLIMDNCGLETIGSAFNTRHARIHRLSFADNAISEIDPMLLNRFHDYRDLNLTGNPICEVHEIKNRFCEI